MPKNILKTDAAELTAVPKPQNNITDGRSYVAVGHDFIINEVRKQLTNYNLEIKEELYISNLNGQVAQGVYHLNHSTDNELGLMFAWGNSYDKTMKFRCAIGGYVFVCGNGMIAGDMSNYGRKHVGEVKEQVSEHIESQIKIASKYYQQLIIDKNAMKQINLSDDEICKLLGKLYIKEDILTSSQLIMCKDQLENPAHDYGTDANCLWTIYNHITYTLKKSHPSKWMDAQKNLHKLIKNMYFAKTIVLDPNQLDLTEVIDETLTEDELASQLYGVDNDPESVIVENTVEEEIEEKTEFSLDDYNFEFTKEDVIINSEPISEPYDEDPIEETPLTDETGLLFVGDFTIDPDDDDDENLIEEYEEYEEYEELEEMACLNETPNELDDFTTEIQVEEFANETEVTLSIGEELHNEMQEMDNEIKNDSLNIGQLQGNDFNIEDEYIVNEEVDNNSDFPEFEF